MTDTPVLSSGERLAQFRQSMQEKPCGCYIKNGGIVYCPLHLAAPELLAAAERALRLVRQWQELLAVPLDPPPASGLTFELDVAITAAKRVQTS